MLLLFTVVFRCLPSARDTGAQVAGAARFTETSMTLAIERRGRCTCPAHLHLEQCTWDPAGHHRGADFDRP